MEKNVSRLCMRVIPIAFIEWAKDASLFFIKTMKKIVA
jgi:hypothetical protein